MTGEQTQELVKALEYYMHKYIAQKTINDKLFDVDYESRADAAEDREQQLRWTLERIKKITENEDQAKYYNGTIKLRNDLIDQTLSTLYPDTPAPTSTKEADHEA